MNTDPDLSNYVDPTGSGFTTLVVGSLPPTYWDGGYMSGHTHTFYSTTSYNRANGRR
jgi:hypothetical protein